MFLGIGLPLAQLAREIAPIESVACGKTAGTVVLRYRAADSYPQIGLGRIELTFCVPQPASISVLAMRKPRRFNSGREFFSGD